MKSNLNILEFRNQLSKNTKINKSGLTINLGIFSIFYFSSKRFRGNFDDKTFRLSLNFNFSSPIYILVGKYNNNGTNLVLDYSIVPINNIVIVWLKYLPILILVAINCMFLFSDFLAPTFVYYLFNAFTFGMILYSRYKINTEKKKLEKQFKATFQIN
jgi:hypothetical protein